MGQGRLLMVVGTERYFGTGVFVEIILTRVDLIIERVIFMFFPSMAMRTLELMLTSIFIVH